MRVTGPDIVLAIQLKISLILIRMSRMLLKASARVLLTKRL